MSASYTSIADGAEATPTLFNNLFGALFEDSVYNVRWFLNSTNTSAVAALRAAISACTSASSAGGVIYLPPGTYSIDTKTAGIAFASADSLTIRGAGPGATILRLASSAFSGTEDVDVFRPASGTLRNFTLEDLTYDGNGANNLPSETNTNHNLLYAETAYNVRIRNVHFKNVAGLRCISLGQTSGANPASNVSNVIIEGCIFDTLADTISGNSAIDDFSAIWLNGRDCAILNNVLRNPSISTVGTAIEIHGSNNVVQGNRIRGWNIGILPGASFGNHLTTTYSDNVMEDVISGYRVYAASNNSLDLTITGDTIAQGKDTRSVIDLGYCTTPARTIRIQKCFLTNSQTTPVGDNGHGIGLGRAERVIIDSCTFERLSGRAVAKSDSSAWAADELDFTLRDSDVIDCSRSTATAGTPSLRQAVGLFSTDTLKAVNVVRNRFVNSGASHMNNALEVNVAMNRLRFEGNDLVGVSDPTFSGVSVLHASVYHTGRSNPNGAIFGTLGSRWNNEATGQVWLKATSNASWSGWSEIL